MLIQKKQKRKSLQIPTNQRLDGNFDVGKIWGQTKGKQRRKKGKQKGKQKTPLKQRRIGICEVLSFPKGQTKGQTERKKTSKKGKHTIKKKEKKRIYRAFALWFGRKWNV